MTNFVSGNRRYLALCFPFLATDRPGAGRTKPSAAPPEPPTAFVEKVKGALRLAAVDPAALSLGLTPGLPLADARARVPDLETHDADPHADQALLDRLADGCLRYTPMVALDPPDGLILDISGCTHLFGGEAVLAGDLETRLTRFGMHVRHAFASSADAARALARFQAGGEDDERTAVRRLPVAALRLDAEAELGLRRAGLKTIGDLASRPMAAIAARFGAQAVTALRRLLGEAECPIAPRLVPPPVYVERRFAEPVARTEYALAVLRELAVEAEQALERRKQGGRRFEAMFFRTDGLALKLPIETGRPERDPAVLMRLMGERIEALSDPIDPGFGFDLIRLSVPAVEALAASQIALEGGETGEAELTLLIDRLSTRMGRSRVRRFRANDTHIPEQAASPHPAVETAAKAGWPLPRAGEPPLRPIHLFDPPQPIEVTAEVPHGPPHRFRWKHGLYRLKRVEGPERIAALWWNSKDYRGLTRDYYRVEDADGRRFWIFRHGTFDERAHPRWYMHGLFA